MCRAVLGHMLEARIEGAILNMGSVTAFSPEPRFFATHAYAAAKGAVESLSVAMAAYYAPHRIRVNVIAPGLVRTPMSARAQGDPAILEYIARKQPLVPGILEPDEIARAAVFLMSDEARAITGQVLAVDAGWAVSGT
jgi:NAD(P)-dependent dehydrogenase (short-subunit alcohol dehydrogenase family)